MTLGQSKSAEQLMEAEKARRPGWRSASRRTPSWFCGGELDLLEPCERNRLYQELRSRRPTTLRFPFFIASVNLANVIRGLHSESSRPLWMAIAIGFALVAFGAWLYRRQGILSAARRHVRESVDWPLRLRNQRPTDFGPGQRP